MGNSKCKNEHEDIQNVKIVIIIQLILIDKSNRNTKSNIKFFISISTALKISYHRLIFLERITSIPASIRDQTETESTVLFVCSPTNANEVSQRTSTRLHNGHVYKVKRSLITRRDLPSTSRTIKKTDFDCFQSEDHCTYFRVFVDSRFYQ